MKRKVQLILILVILLGIGMIYLRFHVNHSISMPDEIVEISICRYNRPDTLFSYTELETIQVIADYLCTLRMTRSAGSSDATDSRNYIITVYSQASEPLTFMYDVTDLGTETFRMGNVWYDISVDQWGQWEPLLCRTLPDQLPEELPFEDCTWYDG